MEAKLNSGFLLLIFSWFGYSVVAQNNDVVKNYPDYKNQEQYKKFQARRHTVAQWQINKLKTGALIVKLKTSEKTISALEKMGNTALAEKKKLEQYALNKIIMIAFLDYYKFSNVYFIYSNYSDSLLKGKKSNLFLDTNLNISPTIVLKEDFYLVAEKDFLYNSTIGFVKEDSAKFVSESGNPERERAFVLKNKYGHQLHKPFPFFIGYHTAFSKGLIGKKFKFPIKIYKTNLQKDSISFTVNKNYINELEEINKGTRKAIIIKENEITRLVEIEKDYLYERISVSIENLSDNLIRFFQSSPMPKDEVINDPLIKPYLY